MVLPSEPAPRGASGVTLRRAAPGTPSWRGAGPGTRQQVLGGTGGNSLQERHSGRLLSQTSDWTRRGEASLLHCLKAQLENQKLYKALKLQVTGKYQTRRVSLH